MNEDYYYDNDTINSTVQVEASSDYYSAKPFTREEFFKSADMAKMKKSFRIIGMVSGIALVIDFFRIWNANIYYDIESYVRLFIGLAIATIIVELVNQKLVNAILCFCEILISCIIAYGAVKLVMFLFIPGVLNLILFAVHFEQCLTYERKWKLYKDVNYKE